MSTTKHFARGARVKLTDLSARADLNGSHATVVSWTTATRRWAVEVEGSDEPVRVKPRNLVLVVPASGPVAENDEEDEPIVLSRGDGQSLAVRPEKLKRRFEEVSQKYALHEHSDRVADFMMGAGSPAVTAERFAAEFETSELDAHDFMSWIQVTVAFKEQHLGAPPGGAS